MVPQSPVSIKASAYFLTLLTSTCLLLSNIQKALTVWESIASQFHPKLTFLLGRFSV